MKITPQSPACLQGRPLNVLIIIIKGTQCGCFIMCVCVRGTNPMTSYHILPSAAQKELWVSLHPQGQKSQNEPSTGSCFHSVTGCSVQPEDICVSVWSPAGLSAKTSSQWAYSQWTGKPSCCIWGSQSWCASLCHYESECDVCEFNDPVSWGLLPSRRWEGEVFLT